MNYLLPALLAVACCNFALSVVWFWRTYLVKTPKPPINLHPASYNLALRDAGEILRDIRVEIGAAPGECVVIEEALGRMRKCWK